MGNIIIDEASIKREGVRFFKELLDPSVKMDVNNHQLNSFLEAIPRIISDQDNDSLMKPFTLEEIQKIVQSLPPDKAPGLDGFTTLFFQKCWDVLGWDLLMALESS